MGFIKPFTLNKKIPAIPPLPVDGKFVSDFYEKSNIFNNFFASICTPIKNASTLPSSSYRTNTRIKPFSISEKDILSIIKSLDPTKEIDMTTYPLKSSRFVIR